jgi:hypothetical protein
MEKTVNELLDINSGIKREYPKVIKQTAIFAFKEIKTDYPKKSGFARQSFQLAGLTPTSYEVASKAPQVNVLENGARAHTVRPKKRKYLTIPIKDSVKTKSGIKQSALNKLFKIKQSALNKLFKELKKPKGRKKYEIFKDVGIVLSKKANIPARRAKKPLAKIFVPKIDKEMIKNTNEMLTKLGFR